MERIVGLVKAMGGVFVAPGQDVLAARTSHLVFLDDDPTYHRSVIKKLESQLQATERDSPISPDKRARSRGVTGSPASERASSVADSVVPKSGSSGKRHARPKLPLFVRWHWVVDCDSAQVCIDEKLYAPEKPALTAQESAKYVSRYTNARRDATAQVRQNVRLAQGGASDTLSVRSKRRRVQTPDQASAPSHASKPTSRLVDNILQGTSSSSAHPAEPSTSKWDEADSDPTRQSSSKRAGDSAERGVGAGSGPRASTVGTSPMPPPPLPQPWASPAATGLFSGILFRLHPELNKPVIMSQLKGAGAVVIRSPDVQVNYTIVPLTYDTSNARAEDGKIVTFFWLEGSLFAQRRIGEGDTSSLDRFYYWPTTTTFPLIGAEQVYIHFTAFDREGPERAHVSRVTQLMGLTHTVELRRENTHLVVGHADRVAQGKLKYASDKKVHVVDLSFLERVYTRGVIDPQPTARLPSRSSQRVGSQLPPSSMLPPTYDPSQPPSLAPLPHARTNVGSHPNRTTTDSLVRPPWQSILSDPNRGVHQRRRAVPRPRQSNTTTSTTSDPKAAPPSLNTFEEAPKEAQDVEPMGEPASAPPQTQVFMSYSDPRTKREQERLRALIEGGVDPDPTPAPRTRTSAAALRVPSEYATRAARRSGVPETIDLVDSSPAPPPPPPPKRARRTSGR